MATSTSYQPILLDRPLGGMSYLDAPHLLSPEQWRTQYNMRVDRASLVQLPRKVVVGFLRYGFQHKVDAIVNLPVGTDSLSKTLVLTDRRAFLLSYPTCANSVWLPEAGAMPFVFETDDEYRRWGHVLYNHRVWFLNDINTLMYSDGDSIVREANSPAGRYVEEYFDHLVVGRPRFNNILYRSRVMWSHLYKTDEWVSSQKNEADHFELVSYSSGDATMWECTGLKRIGDSLVSYTPSAVWVGTYVGLPHVMNWRMAQAGIGNSLPWGLVAVLGAHLFFHGPSTEFYRFDGQQVSGIGGPIIEYVDEYLTTDPELRNRTFGYSIPEKSEAWWIFISQGSTEHDRAVVYNYASQLWYAASVENLSCTGGRVDLPVRCDEMSDAANTVTDTAIVASRADVKVPRLWGTHSGLLLREAAGDAITSMLEQPVPVLETADQHFGSLKDVKEVDTMIIDAKYVTGSGIQLETAERGQLNSPVSFEEKGVWEPYMREGRISVRTHGKVHRHRYSGKGGSTSAEQQNYASPAAFSLSAELLAGTEVDTCGDYDGIESPLNPAWLLGEVKPGIYLPSGPITGYHRLVWGGYSDENPLKHGQFTQAILQDWMEWILANFDTATYLEHFQPTHIFQGFYKAVFCFSGGSFEGIAIGNGPTWILDNIPTSTGLFSAGGWEVTVVYHYST